MSSQDRPKPSKGSGKPGRERGERGSPTHAPISRPIQMPQWPLNNGSNHSSAGNSVNISPATLSPPRSRKRTPPPIDQTPVSPTQPSPPRRPNRPSDVPSMLDGSRIQDPVPTFHSTVTSESEATPPPKNPTWNQGNVLLSPGEPSTPGTGLSGTSNSSRPSTTSSFGSIPDFPVPDIPPQAQQQTAGPPRRSLGPPPSSRRGVSSYYSHNSYVAPIPEEHADGKQHHSYASSSAMPKDWSEDTPDYYMSSYREEDEEDEDGYDDELHDAQIVEPTDATGPVRKASMGRQLKPSLMTVRSNSSSGSDTSKHAAEKAPATAATTMGKAGAIAAIAGAIGTAQSTDLGETLPAKAYGDSKQNSVRASPLASPRTGRSGSSTPKAADPRVRQILGGLEKGGAIGNVDELPPSAIRRPPRLDMGAVRERESRGSMTSLPDLIKRATKLASNLDKGRTASRLGMLDFNSSDPNLLNKLNEHRDRQLRGQGGPQRDSTISGILSHFPAPTQTPNDEGHDGWQQGHGGYDAYGRDLTTPMTPLKPEGDDGSTQHRRRCCGMPLWLFVLIVIILMIVIAAAIVLPVVLVVIPQNNANSNGGSTTDLAACSTSSQCQHGGKPVVANNACQCVCTGGFTGATCTTGNDGACTQANLGGFSSASVGNAVPRVFSVASSQFQINLNATAILAAFATSNIACASENALMAFNGLTQRRALDARQQAVTSNGVVLASSALPTAATVSGTATPTSSASAAPTSTTTGPSGNDEDLARAAILLSLGSSFSLSTAQSVQQALMSKLQDGSFRSAPVNAGAGVSVDFNKRVVTINGTKAG